MPARLRDIKRALNSLGIDVNEPKKGSHWKAVHGTTCYTIPAHAGLKEEVSDVYIKAMCRAFGLDYAEFKAKL